MKVLSGCRSFVHFLLSQGDSRRSWRNMCPRACLRAYGHDKAGRQLKYKLSPSTETFASLLWYLSFIRYLNGFWNSAQIELSSRAGQVEGRSGKEEKGTKLLHSGKLGPREVQHETVMGFLCRQNAIRTIHALQATVVGKSGKSQHSFSARKTSTCSFFICR